jgi:hypothetical protein
MSDASDADKATDLLPLLCPHREETAARIARALADAREQANQRLPDLVRHQRGALHEAGLITDAEYAALASDHGAVARLEGYDAAREQANQRAEQAEQMAETYRLLLAGKLKRTDAKAVESGDLMPGPLAMASLILADTLESRQDAKNRLSWGWDDARTGKGYRVVVEHSEGESHAQAVEKAREQGRREGLVEAATFADDRASKREATAEEMHAAKEYRDASLYRTYATAERSLAGEFRRLALVLPALGVPSV